MRMRGSGELKRERERLLCDLVFDLEGSEGVPIDKVVGRWAKRGSRRGKAVESQSLAQT